MKARADDGKVVIDTEQRADLVRASERTITLSRSEAADVIVAIAEAILNSGDISDPDVQEAVRAAHNLRRYLKE